MLFLAWKPYSHNSGVLVDFHAILNEVLMRVNVEVMQPHRLIAKTSKTKSLKFNQKN